MQERNNIHPRTAAERQELKDGLRTLPTSAILMNFSESRKARLDKGIDGNDFSPTMQVMVDVLEERGAELPSTPRSLLFFGQWSLGLEGETPVGGYYLPGVTFNEQTRSEQISSRRTVGFKKPEVKGQYRLGLDFKKQDTITYSLGKEYVLKENEKVPVLV